MLGNLSRNNEQSPPTFHRNNIMNIFLLSLCLAVLKASAQDDGATTTTAAAASSTDSGVPGGFTAFPGKPSITEILSSESELSMLNTILRNETFSDTLDNLDSFINYTFLAPSNQALQDYLETDAGKKFQQDPEFARNVLSYHALNGGTPVTSDDIPEGGIAQSLWTPSLLIFNESDPSSSGEGVGALKSDGDALFISGFLQNSTVQKVVSLCYGRTIVHWLTARCRTSNSTRAMPTLLTESSRCLEVSKTHCWRATSGACWVPWKLPTSTLSPQRPSQEETQA